MAADPGDIIEMESLQTTSIAMPEESVLSEEEPLRGPLQDISAVRESKNRREEVMEWMKSQYPMLAEAIKTTQNVDSFHLAEENKQEFPHDDALKVTEEMATKLLSNAKQDIEDLRVYLKSMFFCVTPESLTPLAAVMYQELEKTWTCELAHETENLQLRMVFQYEDEKKVIQLCICLFVRGLLNKEAAEQICKLSDKKRIQETMKGMIKKELKGVPKQLLAASEDVQRSLYSAYRGWREIPQTDAEHITEAMVKHLTGSDKERQAYLASMYFSLNHHALLPLVIAMFQKYQEICPDELELLKGDHNKEWNPKFLGRVLFRRNLLTKEEYDKFNIKLTPKELLDRKELRRSEFELHNLEEFFDKLCEEEPYGYDLLDYQRCHLPYDDAVAVSKLIFQLLNGTVHQRKIYLKTMNNLSRWVLGDIAVAELTKTDLPGHDSIGEYNNVAVLMCQQYMDQFPDFYSELEKHISPQYIHLFVKSLWQRNFLSEVAISFYIKSISCHQIDESDKLTISHGLIPLLFSLPTTVYKPAIVCSDASDFSTSVWIQPFHYLYETNFMRILVPAAIEREEQSHPKNEALFQVLVKSLRNDQFSSKKVKIILDIILPQAQLDSDLWRDESVRLYVVAARRGSDFTDVAFRLLEYLNSMSSRVIQLIKDDATDDRTAANIMNRVIDSEAIAFNDNEKVELVKSCFQYAGKGSRSRTAVLLWKCYSDHLKFHNLLSAAKNEDVPLAILAELNIDLDSNTKAEKANKYSLHAAAEKGYTRVVELALERGFTELLIYSNYKDHYPVQVALEKEHYGIAAQMLRAKNAVKQCRLAESSQDTNSTDGVAAEPRVNIRELLDRLKELANMFESSDDDSERADIVHKGEALQECVVAILDSTVDRDSRMNCYDLLEVYNETTPDNRLDFFKCPTIEFIMAHQEHSQFKAIIDHESFQSLVNCKWKIYGQKLFLHTVSIKKWTERHCVRRFSFKKWKMYFTKLLKVYFTDWTNWLDLVAILLTLLVIPFRIADLDVQWVFVALAYILHCLRVFEFAIIKSSFAVYVKTLFQIIKHDIVQFLAVFLVVTISFGGGLYFSLRADTCRLADQTTTNEIGLNFTPAINTSFCLHPDETSQIYLSWFTGIRLLIEGNVIDPYIFGERGFWWFSVIIYMVFLFLVAVIMLNLLIAQFSKSYEEITKTARQTITPDRAKILVKQQSSILIKIFCLKFGLGQGFIRMQENKLRSSQCKKTDDENVSGLGKIHKQLFSSTTTVQKQFRELRAQLKEVKDDIAKSSQGEVVKELQSEVRSLAASLGEVKDMVQQVLQK